MAAAFNPIVMQTEIDYVSHLPSFYSSLLLNLYKNTSLSTAQLNLVFILIVNIIFGYVYSRIETKLRRQIFGMITGFLSMYLLYGMESFYLLLFILSIYPIIIKYKDPNIIFWITHSILFITLSYFCFMYYPIWRIDFTMSLMGITVRLQMLTYNLYDHHVAKTQLTYSQKVDDDKKRKEFDEYKKKHMHDQITLFQYLAYMLFFLHALCGSNLTINDFINISNNYYEGWNRTAPPRPSPSHLLKALGEILLVSLIYGLSQLTIWCYPDLYSSSASFTMMRVIIISFSGFLGLFKYHIAWTICDFTALISGVSYSATDYNVDGSIKRIHWNRAKNINSIPMLYPNVLQDIYKNWNMTIEHWLHYYVAHRFNENNKLYRMIKTRIAAAMFHGVYPGYYVFFIVSVPVQSFIETLHKKLPNNKIIRGLWPMFVIFVCGFHFHWILNLDTSQVFGLMHSIYWFPYWFPFIVLFVAYIVGKLL